MVANHAFGFNVDFVTNLTKLPSEQILTMTISFEPTSPNCASMTARARAKATDLDRTHRTNEPASLSLFSTPRRDVQCHFQLPRQIGP